MFTITLRKNQRRMTTLVTKHHLGGAELARLLCRFATSEQPDVWGRDRQREGATLTRAQVEKITREAIQDWGRDAYLSEDGFNAHGGYTTAEAHTIVAWAVAQIRRLYPAMADAELDAFLLDYTATEEHDEEDDLADEDGTAELIRRVVAGDPEPDVDLAASLVEIDRRVAPP